MSDVKLQAAPREDLPVIYSAAATLLAAKIAGNSYSASEAQIEQAIDAAFKLHNQFMERTG